MRIKPYIGTVFCCDTFTGKENDEETGYGYFGARYMDHELMTMWISVDPMADKYPSISPYAYCAWNPVRLVDPNGEDTIVSISLKNGDISFWGDDESSNGTTVNFYYDDNLIDNHKCTGSVSMESCTSASQWMLIFSENTDANAVFDKLIGNGKNNIESEVEWNYYEQIDKTGELLTSMMPDEINVGGLEKRYGKNNTSKHHHYHPKQRGYAWWTPSESDQSHSLELNVPSYLHFDGQLYRYDDIVRNHGVLNYTNFQPYIPLTIIKPTY